MAAAGAVGMEGVLRVWDSFHSFKEEEIAVERSGADLGVHNRGRVEKIILG